MSCNWKTKWVGGREGALTTNPPWGGGGGGKDVLWKNMSSDFQICELTFEAPIVPSIFFLLSSFLPQFICSVLSCPVQIHFVELTGEQTTFFTT